MPVSKPYSFLNGTAADAAQVNANFDTIYADSNNNVVRKDGSVVMTGQLVLPNSSQTLSNQACSVGKAQSLIGAPAIPGMIGMFGGSVVPTGWLLCDGAAVSRATYANLFGAIGTTHGVGNGSTTFNVPDLLGRSPMGSGTGSGLNPRYVGTKIGSEFANQDVVNKADTPLGGVATVSAVYHTHVIIHPVTVVLMVIKY